MFFHIIGSCSGTEPMPGRDYTAWVLEEENGRLLWFDAGGGCSSRAYCKGLSPLKTGALFLSHPHLDHTGGLPMLLGAIRKEKWLRRPENSFETLHVYSNTPEILRGAVMLMRASAPVSEPWDYEIAEHPFSAGEIYRDSEVAVEARPNNHLPSDPVTGTPRSWSFRIRELKTGNFFIYTGDVKSLDDLGGWLDAPARLLMLETGHHRAAELCSELRRRNAPAEELLFLHHGVEILRDPAGEKSAADAAWGKPVLFASDGMTLAL